MTTETQNNEALKSAWTAAKLLAGIVTVVAFCGRAIAATARDPQASKPVHAAATATIGAGWWDQLVNGAMPTILFIATVLSILWYAVTIYESKTADKLRKWIAHRRETRPAREAAREKERWRNS